MCILVSVISCDPNPCRNLGTCTGDPQNYVCECQPNFEGKICEKRKSDTYLNSLCISTESHKTFLADFIAFKLGKKRSKGGAYHLATNHDHLDIFRLVFYAPLKVAHLNRPLCLRVGPTVYLQILSNP